MQQQNLWEAAQAGDLQRVQYLVSLKPSEPPTNLRLPYSWNIHMWNDRPVREAATYGHLFMVQYLHEQKADIFACSNDALRWAAIHGHLPVAEYLLQHKADPQAAIEWVEQDSRIQKLLKSYGARVLPAIPKQPENVAVSSSSSCCCLWWHGY